MTGECEIALRANGEGSTTGASETGHRAAQCLMLFSETLKNPSPSGFKRDLLDFTRRLLSSQPAIAPLLDLANSVLRRTELHRFAMGLRVWEALRKGWI